MRPESERRVVGFLAAGKFNASEIADIAGIPRSTVRDWLRQPMRPPRHPPSIDLASIPQAEYSYLLGFYLGDGTISCSRKGVYRLRITTDARYPGIIEECLPYRAVVVSAYSKAWPLLFPQHGPGRKHRRTIELAPWQAAIVARYPRQFLRGLIHSDGCRVLNRVNGKDYPRYFFDQVSDDIRRLFCDTCRQLGIDYTWSRWKTVSIARARSVALVDSFVGPKA